MYAMSAAAPSLSAHYNSSAPALLAACPVPSESVSAAPLPTELRVPERVNAFYGLGQTLRNWVDQARWPRALASAVTRAGESLSNAVSALGERLPGLTLPGAAAAPAGPTNAAPEHGMEAGRADDGAARPAAVPGGGGAGIAARGAAGGAAGAAAKAADHGVQTHSGLLAEAAAAAAAREAIAAFDDLPKSMKFNVAESTDPVVVERGWTDAADTYDAMRSAVVGLAAEGPRTAAALTAFFVRHDGLVLADKVGKLPPTWRMAKSVPHAEQSMLYVHRGTTQLLDMSLAMGAATERSCLDETVAQPAVDACLPRLIGLGREAESCVGRAAAPDCADVLKQSRAYAERSWPTRSCNVDRDTRVVPGFNAFVWKLEPVPAEPHAPRLLSAPVDARCRVNSDAVRVETYRSVRCEPDLSRLTDSDLSLIRMAHHLRPEELSPESSLRPASTTCRQVDAILAETPERVLDQVCPELATLDRNVRTDKPPLTVMGSDRVRFDREL